MHRSKKDTYIYITEKTQPKFKIQFSVLNSFNLISI